MDLDYRQLGNRETEPEIVELRNFLSEFNRESDRGAALIAASMLDARLKDILVAFLADVPSRHDLIQGYNAPLGAFSARASAAHTLGLIQKNEYEEITLIRKIRNKFGHSWEGISFSSGPVADLCRELPWLGPADHESTSTLRGRFNAAVAILLTDLLWRVRLVAKEQRRMRIWPNKSREQQ